VLSALPPISLFLSCLLPTSPSNLCCLFKNHRQNKLPRLKSRTQNAEKNKLHITKGPHQFMKLGDSQTRIQSHDFLKQKKEGNNSGNWPVRLLLVISVHSVV
jgi:hypothetical protein